MEEPVDIKTATERLDKMEFTEMTKTDISRILKRHVVDGSTTHVNFTDAEDEINRENTERMNLKFTSIKEHVDELRTERQWWIKDWSDEKYYPRNSELGSVISDSSNNKTKVINPTELARLFIRHVPALMVNGANPTIYTFNMETGLWTSDESFIGNWMQNVYDTVKDSKLAEFSGAYSPNKAIKDAIEEVKRTAVILGAKYSFDASMYSNLSESKGGVPLANGVLCFNEKFEPYLEPYSPHWLFTVKTAHGYYKDANFDKALTVLRQWMPDTDEEEERDEEGNYKEGHFARFKRLVQFPAQIIVQQYMRVSWKKTYYGYGAGNCGKTTFADAVGFLFGKWLGSKTKINNLSSDFGKEAIAGKWFNTPDETHAKNGVNMDEFKDVYGSNEMEVNAKYKKPEIKPMIAVGYHAGNTMMKATAETRRDSAYLRRWIIYHFEVEFPVDPQWESDNFTEEFFNGFMYLAVSMAADIIKNKKLLFEMSAEDVLEEFSLDDNLNEWIFKNFFEKRIGKKIGTQELINAGYAIPVKEVKEFFVCLEAAWDLVNRCGVVGYEDYENKRSSIPTADGTISTTMTSLGVEKARGRGEYMGDGITGQRRWYVGVRFKQSTYGKLMQNKI